MKTTKLISKQPFFSVIIATYNRENLLKRAINSLLLQTEPNWEAIIVDDGSTDFTSDVISYYKEKDQRIKTIFQSNQGSLKAKNTGIFAANGNYITFLDSDDEYDQDHLLLRKNIILANPDTDMLHGGFTVFGNPYVADRFDTTKLIHLNNCTIGGTFFIKREILHSLNGFSGNEYGFDAEFMERVKTKNLSILQVTHPTYFYHREHDYSLTHEKAKNK